MNEVASAEELTAGRMVAAALQAAVTQLREQAPGVRAGHDPDPVRKARVATRRLRSNLRTFESLLRPEPVAAVQPGLEQLAAELAGLRDREVLLARLEADAAHLAKPDREILAALTDRLRAEIRAARTSATAYLDSPLFGELMEKLDALAGAPPMPEAGEPASKLAVKLARPPWERLRKAIRRLPRNPSDPQLHRIRILAKRSRYAAQAVAPAVGEVARDFALAAADLQDVLGEHQDAVTTEAWLVSQEPTPATAFAAGRLAGFERAAAVAARGRWREVWKALNQPDLRSWLDAANS